MRFSAKKHERYLCWQLFFVSLRRNVYKYIGKENDSNIVNCHIRNKLKNKMINI